MSAVGVESGLKDKKSHETKSVAKEVATEIVASLDLNKSTPQNNRFKGGPRKAIICFRCKKPGHKINECRSGPRNGEQ